MLKKLIITAAAMLLMFGTAANAQYYQDRYYDRKNAVLKDGTAYVGAYWDDWFYMDCEGEGESATLSFKGNSLTVTADSDKAEFNGSTITLTNIPYMNGEYVMLPVREIVELFGGYVHYEDETGDVVAECGHDIIKESGTLGDSYNNWNITMPEGFYHYSDSVDSSTVYFDNFNGVRISVMMAKDSNHAPDSLNIEDYLYRREIINKGDENNNYTQYIIEGKVYSNPTPENRTLLNSIMDSFKPYFSEDAVDISNINEGRTAWKYSNIEEGISFDIPLSWDDDYNLSSYSEGYVRNSPNVSAFKVINSGFNDLPHIIMKTSLIKNVSAEEFIDTFKKDAEYVSAEVDPVFENVEIGDIDAYRLEYQYDSESSTNVPNVCIICDDGNNVHLFNFDSLFVNNMDIQETKQKMDDIIEKILSTLKFYEPEGNGNIYFTTDMDMTEEIDVNGFKFSVPKRLLLGTGNNSAILFLNNSNTDIYNILSVDTTAVISCYDDIEYTEFIENLKNNPNVSYFEDMGECNIEGKNYNKCNFILTNEKEGSSDGYVFMLTSKKINKGTVYYDGEKYVVAVIVFEENADMDSQYVKDLQAVIDSVH